VNSGLEGEVEKMLLNKLKQKKYVVDIVNMTKKNNLVEVLFRRFNLNFNY
jgi:hypothetical protein